MQFRNDFDEVLNVALFFLHPSGPELQVFFQTPARPDCRGATARRGFHIVDNILYFRFFLHYLSSLKHRPVIPVSELLRKICFQCTIPVIAFHSKIVEVLRLFILMPNVVWNKY